MGQRRSACRIFVGKYERKESLGMSKRRWENNTNMQCKGNKLEGSFIGLSWHRIRTSGRLMKLQVPQNAGIS